MADDNAGRKVLIRAFVGRVGDEAIVDLPDAEIEKIVLADLGKIMNIKGKPDFTVITRWKKDRPQYRVGHKQRIEAAREELKSKFPHVKLAGALMMVSDYPIVSIKEKLQ